ncbi:MAG: GFA family protein, partial [Betaproteobacteria bacterium]|nr:GFA family protein [Betaproteobacteria bacterium]
MSSPAPGTAVARCHCGDVEIVAAFPSRFCAHCYCRSCRTSHAAGVVTWIGFRRSQVSFARGAELLRDYESSRGTHRRFCGACGTRMTFESTHGPWADEVHLPLALFVTP